MSHHSLSKHAAHRSRSSLARLQRGIVLWILLVAVWAVTRWWDTSPAGALWLGAVIVMGYSGLLGLQFLLGASQQARDPVPKPGFVRLLKAWWQETGFAAAVFGWRQPFAWRQWPDTWHITYPDSRPERTRTVDARETDPSSQPVARPVVFIHGFVCNRGFWHPWMSALRSRGIPYVSMNLEPVFAGIDDFVAQVEAAVRQVEDSLWATSDLQPVLICHSMGGLVARAWLATEARNSGRVHRVITIGTPHQGTWLARWGHTASGQQMRIGSAWLQALRQREATLSSTAQRAPFTCWYSNTDNIVFPATTATLTGADNRLVEGAGHVALAFHPTVMRESLAMLASGDSSPMLRTAS